MEIINKSKAIEWLEMHREAVENKVDHLILPGVIGEFEINTINYIIDALQSMGSADLISRRNAIETVGDWMVKEFGYLDLNRAERLIDAIEALTSSEPKTEWIPVSERLPKCEQEVLICTEKKIVGRDVCIDSIVTPAIYEDGTMLEVESI